MSNRNGSYPLSVQPGIPNLSETPKGWKRETLRKHLKEIKRPVVMKDDEQYRLVTVKRSRGGVVEREKLLGKEIKVKSQFLIKTGDFLISKRQIVHGACGIVPEKLDGSIVSNEYAVLGTNGGIDLEFLKFLSESAHFQQTCFHSSIGVHVEKMIFKLEWWFKWEFSIPPLFEQEKIAHILFTWDIAIKNVEKLIKNSQQRKRALMQQLLTGKKRFKEFGEPVKDGDLPEKWQEIRLRDFGCCITGLTYSPDQVVNEDGLLVLRSSNIQGGMLAFKDNVFVNCEVAKENLTQESDILICVRNGSKKLIGKTALINGRAIGVAHGAFMTLFRSKDSNYIYQLFQTPMYYKQVFQNLGATINSINSSNLYKFRFPYPPKKERERIASVLTKCDLEYENFMQQLISLKEEKKALMQQLLTGKRRIRVEQ
jgi:type I restriction enzyme, S subunit